VTIIDRLKKVHTHGQRAEKKASGRLGVRKNPGSGAVEGLKGDLTADDFLIENKTTEHRSISLKMDWLEKIHREARQVGRSPAVTIQFVDKLGNPVPYGRWALIPEDEFKDVISQEDK
jgi:hypothetical protein